MPYTTYKDLEDAAGGAERFLQLADWDDDSAPDAGVIARAQADADGFIDAHLRKFSPADLERLRASPTATIVSIAAAETIYQIRSKRHGASQTDLDERKQRIETLRELRADKLRADDQKAPRARIVEPDEDATVTRKNTRGMW